MPHQRAVFSPSKLRCLQRALQSALHNPQLEDLNQNKMSPNKSQRGGRANAVNTPENQRAVPCRAGSCASHRRPGASSSHQEQQPIAAGEGLNGSFLSCCSTWGRSCSSSFFPRGDLPAGVLSSRWAGCNCPQKGHGLNSGSFMP